MESDKAEFSPQFYSAEKAEKYSNEHNVKFSTDPEPAKSKTKGIIFRRKPCNEETYKLNLCGNPLPWIEGAKYLGNKWTNEINGLKDDVKIKRARYIERNCEILKEFYFIHPELLCKINKIYNSSFPGSVLWDLTSRNVELLINSWSVSVRQMWKLPYQTHRYFIEPLGGIHAKVMLITRFIQFIHSIDKGKKSAPLYLLEKVQNNLDTITGRNMMYILDELEEDNFYKINIKKVKKNFKFSNFPENNEWKINLIKDLTDVKMQQAEVKFDNGEYLYTSEIDDLLNYVSTC